MSFHGRVLKSGSGNIDRMFVRFLMLWYIQWWCQNYKMNIILSCCYFLWGKHAMFVMVFVENMNHSHYVRVCMRNSVISLTFYDNCIYVWLFFCNANWNSWSLLSFVIKNGYIDTHANRNYSVNRIVLKLSQQF